MSPFAGAVTAVIAAAAASAAVSKVLLAMFVAMTVETPGSVERKFVASLDLSATELMLINADLVGLYFVSVLLIAPLAAALCVVTDVGGRLSGFDAAGL